MGGVDRFAFGVRLGSDDADSWHRCVVDFGARGAAVVGDADHASGLRVPRVPETGGDRRAGVVTGATGELGGISWTDGDAGSATRGARGQLRASTRRELELVSVRRSHGST